MSDVSELEGEDLDRAVAQALGRETASRSTGLYARFLELAPDAWSFWSPSTLWVQGGPIIERERILLSPYRPGVWRAVHLPSGDASPDCVDYGEQIPPLVACEAATPLIAAMRCFVASRTPAATGEKP